MAVQDSKSSSRVFLMVAIVLGVLATVTTFAFLESSTGKERGPRFEVLVAARALRTNQPIDPEKDLKKIEVPASFADLKDRSLRPEFLPTLKGQRVNRPIPEGQIVMLADVAAVADFNPEKGKCAFSIPVKKDNGNNLSIDPRLLVPGQDRVKLYVTRGEIRAKPRAASDTGEPAEPVFSAPTVWKTEAILPEPVRVLAVGSKLVRSRQQITAAAQYDAAAEMESMLTVTVEVTDEQYPIVLEKTGASSASVSVALWGTAPTTGPAR